MGKTYGRNVLSPVAGNPVQVIADGCHDGFKAGGVTIDWETVDAVENDPVTLDDGNVVPVGGKYLRYGQVVTKIAATGKFGPFDPDANDGRELLARGDCFIVNQTMLESGLNSLVGLQTDHPAVFDAGLVWKARLLVGGGGSPEDDTLAEGPTFANFEAAFPGVRYVTN